MPRWFQRVWTLQEFILPEKLTFLVEDLDARLVQMVNGLSRTSWKSHLGFCKCSVPSDLLEFDPPSIREIRHPENATYPAPRVDVVDSVGDVCPNCRKGMLIRGPSCVNGKQIHFIDREAYLFIVRAGFAIDEVENIKHEEMLCGLFGLLEAGKVDPRLIIMKIGERFCSHAEDRVLSILGLLGVKLHSNEQLRTGKTLDEQIIEAASKCHPDTLALLFATDGVGYPTKGMSWAPNFRDSWESLICGWNDNSHCRIDRDTKRQWIGGIQRFERKVEILGVSAVGIRVACKKVNGHVSRICCEDQDELINGALSGTDAGATHGLFRSSDDKQIMSLEASSWMFDSVPSEKGESDHVMLRAADDKFQIIYLVSTSDNHSRLSVTVRSEILPPDANKQAAKGLARLDVCMLLLGAIEEDGRELIMVCLEDKEELHKLGILVLPANQSSIIFGDQLVQTVEECMIGGFGRDLSQFVKLHQRGTTSEGIDIAAKQLLDMEEEEQKEDGHERLYLVCKGLLCPPMGGPAVPHHLNPELYEDVHDRLPIPELQCTKHHHLNLKHL